MMATAPACPIASAAYPMASGKTWHKPGNFVALVRGIYKGLGEYHGEDVGVSEANKSDTRIQRGKCIAEE